MNLRATLLLAALPCTTLADTLPARAATAFDTLGPLLAGTYTGTCKARPDLEDAKAPAAIAVSAAGKVRAPGVTFDLRDSLLAELSRTTDRKTPQARAVFRTMYEESYFLLLPQGDTYMAAAHSDKQEFGCEQVNVTSTLKDKPFALSMAAALDIERTVACRRGEGDTPRNAVFRLTRGQVRIDDQTLDLTQAHAESLAIGRGRGMQYDARLANGRTFVALYDDRGDIREVGILAGEEPVVGCEGGGKK
jgi:hypothetical protein